MSDGDLKRSPTREFGHSQNGYAVEFNLDGVCACRTLTVETREEAEILFEMLESREDTDSVEVVYDG